VTLKVVASLLNKVAERDLCNLGVCAGSLGQGMRFCRVNPGSAGRVDCETVITEKPKSTVF
jgi:hypothetical protein